MFRAHDGAPLPAMTIASLLLHRTVTIFTHPYWGSGPFIAKFSVALATILWGTAVLIEANPLDPQDFPAYFTLVNAMPSSFWAWGAFIIGGGTVLRLMLKKPPVAWGALVYFAMMMFWCYLAVTLWIQPYPLRPAQAAGCVTIGLLAIYAFMATPRRRAPVDESANG